MGNNTFRLSDLNRCDIYLAVWILYSLQGVIYPQGLINTGLQFILIFWGLFAVSSNLSQKKPGLIRATVVLLSMYMLYGGLYLLFPSGYRDFNGTLISSYKYLQISLNSLLPILLFYKYSTLGYLNRNRLVVYAFVFLAIFLIHYVDNQNNLLLKSLEAGVYREEFTNNVAYEFLTLMPFACFLYKKPLWQYLYISVLLLFLILGMKRGAIMIGAICFIYFLRYNYKNAESRIAKRAVWIFSAVILVGVFFLISNLLENSYYFTHRLEETLAGDSSGRDDIYSSILTGVLNDDSFIHLLVGRGAYSTISYAGHLAHQDWLETLCNNGVVGVFILLSFFISYFRDANNSRHLVPGYITMAFFMSFFICLIRSFMSMSIQNLELSQTLLLGYLVYRNQYTSYNDINE